MNNEDQPRSEKTAMHALKLSADVIQKRADFSTAHESANIEPYAIDSLMIQSWKLRVPVFFLTNFGVNRSTMTLTLQLER